jgi:hypothetical protein
MSTYARKFHKNRLRAEADDLKRDSILRHRKE